MKASAEELSKARKAEAVKLCDSIRGALADLSFMEVKFDMVFDRLSFPSAMVLMIAISSYPRM